MEADLFTSDSFKKQILESEGIQTVSEDSDLNEIQFIESDDSSSDISRYQDIISNTPKIPNGVKNIIQDASILSRNDKEQKAQELNASLNQVMTRYNKEYGLSLNIDFSNMSRTLVAISDPKDRRTLELYLSEIFQSVRPMLILQMISKLSLAIDYVMDPQRIFGGELQLSDVWIVCQKILEMIQQLEALKDDIIIKGSELELKKIGQENQAANGNNNSLADTEAVKYFMEMFKSDNGL